MARKILLVDDSVTIQSVVALTFAEEDFEIVVLGDGGAAVERVGDLAPDIVLCDVVIPGKDGYEVCESIKRDPATAHLPVLLLRGAFEPFDEERARRAGCDGVVAKPFEPQKLVAEVKRLVR